MEYILLTQKNRIHFKAVAKHTYLYFLEHIYISAELETNNFVYVIWNTHIYTNNSFTCVIYNTHIYINNTCGTISFVLYVSIKNYVCVRKGPF